MRLELNPPQPHRQLLWPRFTWPRWPLKLVFMLIILTGFGLSYQLSAQPVALLVNDQAFSLRTHRLTVEMVLLESGVILKPEDIVFPPPATALQPEQALEIRLARPVVVNAVTGEHPQTILTHLETPAQIFDILGIPYQEADEIYVDDQPWDPEKPLPVKRPNQPAPTSNLRTRIEALRPQPVRLALNQAIPVHIVDGETKTTLSTTAQSVGQILLAQNIPLYLGDAISPDLSAPLEPDLEIKIERSVPVSVQVDGQIISTRSRRKTIGQVLSQEGIILAGQDYTIPAEQEPLVANTGIQVVRVQEVLEIEKETTAYETIWTPNSDLELDVQTIEQPGQEGVTKTRTRVLYENGQEVSRDVEETWLEQEPADKIIHYGTKVVIRTLDTPEGPVEYWRKIRVLATSYSAATSGKSESASDYGITRTGLRAGYGVVAIDPSVVPLRSQLYVPGYGEAIAGDTGGSILGKHIDLGFDEDVPPSWYRWVDIYLLTPVPRGGNIRYVLPQWPQER